MAAETHAPRIVRETTNMERAAKAASIRAGRGRADHVDPDLIDNALADLEIAKIFLDATDRYFDDLNEWLNPNGYAPNRALHEEVHKGQTIMREADDRLGLAEVRLKTALDQALNAQEPRPHDLDGGRFETALKIYHAKFIMGTGFYLLHTDANGGLSDAEQASWDDLVISTRDAALDVLLAPAATPADMATKQDVIDSQEATFWDGNDVAAYTRQLIADAIALAGGAA